ncbi:hypothetical protein [Streptomyces sp. AJS327]|nr:hypothetical protein [Streptomyces sp. AJS327]
MDISFLQGAFHERASDTAPPSASRCEDVGNVEDVEDDGVTG